MDFRCAGGKLVAMSEPQNASGATVFILITLTAIYWGAVCVFAVGQFWVICSPMMTPDCPTVTDSAMRASGIVLVAGVAFAAMAFAIRAIFNWK